MNQLFWHALALTPGIGHVTLKKIFLTYPDLSAQTLAKARHLTKKLPTIGTLNEQINQACTQRALHERAGIQMLSIADPLYPKQLLAISNPPKILYAKGNLSLLQQPMIAVVGTRMPTEESRRITRLMTAECVKRGYAIVSGLAVGVDTVAHKTALATNGYTVAVLAGDLTQIYPKENGTLAAEILQQGGLLVSEVAIGQKIMRGNFAARNRIQSGLSLGVCPIQVTPTSGTMHTVKAAIQQKRLLFNDKEYLEKISSQLDHLKKLLL